MLDPAYLDTLRTKAVALKADLEAATKSRANAVETRAIDAAKQLQDLYAEVKRLHGMADDLPTLVMRLKTLEAVHLSGAKAVQRLHDIECTAAGLADELRANKETLDTLRGVRTYASK